MNTFSDFFHFQQDWWPWPIDDLIRFWLISNLTLTLNFQGQIWNLLYVTQKWFDWHKMKSKNMDSTLDHKFEHQIWPWPWPWVLDLQFSRSNMKFAMSQPIMVQLPRNTKQTYQLNSSPYMWPSDLTLAMTLTLNFPGQIWNLLYLSKKIVELPWNEKQTYWVNSSPYMWPSDLTLAMTLTLEFSRSNMEFAIFQQKMIWLPQNESKLPIELKASNMTITYDLGHDLESQGVGIYQIVAGMSLCCRLL